MFRRMYLTISALLIVSTALLLILLGGTVYRELGTALSRESQDNLEQFVGPIEDSLSDTLRQKGGEYVVGLGDANVFHNGHGENVYFYAIANGHVFSSPRRPVPFSVIMKEPHVLPGHFGLRIHNGVPYRVYAFTATEAGKHVPVYSYVPISEEVSALRHTRKLMWTVGGVGFVIALICNLILARRFLRPTVRAWSAYRETVLELSHELQTPLATVNAMMTNRDVHPDTAKEVRQELERASKMVSDMLFLSRLRSGVKERATEPVAISDITEELGERFQSVARANGIDLVGSADAGLFVETTPGEWERLVSTLFKNVIDHASPHGPATWTLVGDGKRICFTVTNSVRDTPSTGATRAPERGVGLQIVSRLVREMKGTVEVTQEAENFVVVVHLPAKRPRW